MRRVWFLGAIVLAAFTQGNLPVAALREEMRIVSNDASPGTSLTAVGPGSLVLRDGRILTMHSAEVRVRVFDSNGKFLRMLGAAGDGPGEFRTPLVLGTVGDSIWVFDTRGRRYEIYGPDLKPLGRMAMPARGVNIPQFALTSARTAIGMIGSGDTAKAGIYGDTGLVRLIAFQFKQKEHRFQVNDPGGALPGLRSIESPLQARNELAMSRDGRDVFAVEPGETWGGSPGQIRISRVSMSTGQLLAPVTVSLPARRITARERDSIIGEVARASPRIESQIRSQARLPENYPPYFSIHAMGDGLIWLREHGRPQERIALDATGRVLMRIRLPASVGFFAATRTHAWGVSRDANDLPIVLRYRIVAQ